MHPLDSATALVILTRVCLTASLPLLLWLGLGNHRDGNARLWYTGLTFFAVAVIALGSRQSAWWGSGASLLISSLLCLEAVRRENGMDPASPRTLTYIGLGFIAIEIGLDTTGHPLTWGFLFTNIGAISLDAAAVVLLFRHSRLLKSRGLIMAMAGYVPTFVVSFARITYFIVSGQPDGLFAGRLLPETALLAATLASVLKTVGYMFFALEKAYRQHLTDALELAIVNERRAAAEGQAEAMRQVVAERDQMIMISSRFSALNSLTTFNSAVVHEISQPLHALRSSLDVLWLRSSGIEENLRDDLAGARALAAKMGDVVASLRKMIALGRPELQRLEVAVVLGEILAIGSGTALRAGVTLRQCICTAAAKTQVMANQALLARIMLNLVTNALEAHATSSVRSACRWIDVGVRHQLIDHADRVVIAVRDNGPGLPTDILENGPGLLRTTKPNGSGVGLALADMIIGNWGGQFALGNWSEGKESGAWIEIRLPPAR